MAREIVVTAGGATSRFGLERVSRDKLYGVKRRVIVDEDGRDCVTATLARDGSALLGPGAVAQLYLDDADDVVERDELVAVDADGQPLPRYDSTLGAEQPLDGPIPCERVLDFVTTAVYALDPAELDPELAASLAAGDIYETRFSYRGGTDLAPLFLLQNEHGVFGLVGEPADFAFLHRELPPPEDDDDPFDDDELDFSML